MNKNLALLIAGIVFGLVSLMHLLRLVFMFNVIVDNYFVPLWVNAIGFLISFILCVLMFVARR